uniref:Uncharacterized protein n=1 Tax=Romanomermis culicivorax TaxID=13658 RepID=A0A915KHZ5_ROMCU
MDRAHRIGQQRTVNVYRLICKETLEEKILRCQSLKLDASQTVICDQNRSINSMNTDQLLDLLCDDESNDNEKKLIDQSPSSRKKEMLNMAAMEKLWDQSQREYDEAFDVKSFVKSM